MPRRVVLAPDVLLCALYDPRARAILNEWRDGLILPIVTRELLLLYVRTLNQAGLNTDLIRKWSLWLTTPGKSLYLENAEPLQKSGLELCDAIAHLHQASVLTLSHRGTATQIAK
jgi:hypothetical protein